MASPADFRGTDPWSLPYHGRPTGAGDRARRFVEALADYCAGIDRMRDKGTV